MQINAQTVYQMRLELGKWSLHISEKEFGRESMTNQMRNTNREFYFVFMPNQIQSCKRKKAKLLEYDWAGEVYGLQGKVLAEQA